MVLRIAVSALCLSLMLCWTAQSQDWLVAQGQNQERIAGLLALPEVYGVDPCELFVARKIDLYSSASTAASPIGVIERLNPPRPPAQPDCDEPVVVVRRLVDNSSDKLPFDESGYEYRKAVVYERSGRWFRIAIPKGSAWIQRSDDGDFMPYPDELKEEAFSTYLRQGWNGNLSQAPGGPSTAAPSVWRSHASEEIPIRIIATQIVRGESWIHIRFETERCGVTVGALPPLEGWIPAHLPSKATSVWFYSRGC